MGSGAVRDKSCEHETRPSRPEDEPKFMRTSLREVVPTAPGVIVASCAFPMSAGFLPASPRCVHSLSSVAHAAGVSLSTASRALRHDPQIAAATRLRVQQVAREVAYASNPYVSVLMSRLRQSRPAPYRATIAWLDRLPVRAWREDPVQREFFLGAHKRAAELGFQLDRVPCRPGIDPARLREILRCRGIDAVLCSADRLGSSYREFPLDVSGLAIATVGCRFTGTDLHFSTNDQFATARLGHRRLRALGYRRVGFVTTRALEEQVDYRFSGGFGAVHAAERDGEPVPIFFADEQSDAELNGWLDRFGPEAVLTTHLADVAERIRRSGRRIPRDVAFAMLDVERNDGGLAGVCQEHERVGAGAVDLVVSQINRGEFGVPAHAQGMLVEGLWMDGPTAPQRLE